MMWDDGGYYFGWPGMLLVMVVTWALVGAGVYLGARWLGRDQKVSGPLDIIDERLARGEIDLDEYARLRQAISDRRAEVASR